MYLTLKLRRASSADGHIKMAVATLRKFGVITNLQR